MLAFDSKVLLPLFIMILIEMFVLKRFQWITQHKCLESAEG